MTNNNNKKEEENIPVNNIEDKTSDMNTLPKSDKVDLICLNWYDKPKEGGPLKESTICLKMNQSDNINNNGTLTSKLKESQNILVSKEKGEDTITNLGLAFKDFVSTHMTEPLKNYSIVYAKDSSDSLKELTESDVQKITEELQDKKKQNVKEINIGEKTEIVVGGAERAIKKTHQLSKEMVNSWQNGNTPDKLFQSINYSNTIKVLKDRATLIIDVAIGKYDKKDDDNNIKKNNNDKPNDKDK